jgi:hypothetical protein
MFPIPQPDQINYTLRLGGWQCYEMLVPLQVLPSAFRPTYFNRPHGLCRKQVTMWSFTMPTACMWA